MSVQEAYRLYREGSLFVNRRYQRKLVWTIPEKQKLIDSLLHGYPVPLILLAERPELHGSGKYEIIDGMQRLNAIFGFIENAFSVGEKNFDVREFARAKQVAETGAFSTAPGGAPLLSPGECAALLDYQLAVTIYPTTEETEITAVFNRINSGGKQLSNQERRQAGVLTPFGDLVRRISAELRGDASREVLNLSEMPEVSIEWVNTRQGYGINAEDTLWCKQGIITAPQLRDSEDEELVADIAASILLHSPIPASREYFDDLYAATSIANAVNEALVLYGPDRIFLEIISTFSVLRETIEVVSAERHFLRKTVNPASGNPIKQTFYPVFMAFLDLTIIREMSPAEPDKIFDALKGLRSKLEVGAHYAKTEDRRSNIDLTIGLIERYFVKKEPPAFRHGPGLALDFENSLRRSKIETPRYEFKQGLLRLSSDRAVDPDLPGRMIDTICAIANLGPDSNGFLYLGVANSKKDSDRIKIIDSISPTEIGDTFVVGVDRELRVLKIGLEQYVSRITGAINSSPLTEPLKTQVQGKVDIITYRGMSIIRFVIPRQDKVSFVGDKCFTRNGSSTVEVNGPRLVAVSDLFPSQVKKPR